MGSDDDGGGGLGGGGNDDLRTSLLRLSTSSIDGLPRSKRNVILDSVIQLVALSSSSNSSDNGSSDNDNVVDGGGDNKGGEYHRRTLAQFATQSSSLSNYCCSTHASRRMCTILQTAIIASCVNNDERDTLQTLCLGLCQLLAKDNHAALLDEVVVKFSKQQQDGLSKVFLTLAQDDHQCSTNNFGPSIIFTALSLAAATTTKDDDGIKSTLMELFLTSSSLTSSSTKTSSTSATTTTFPQPNQIIMAKYALS